MKTKNQAQSHLASGIHVQGMMLLASSEWQGRGLIPSVGQDSHGRVGREATNVIENCDINLATRTVITKKPNTVSPCAQDSLTCYAVD